MAKMTLITALVALLLSFTMHTDFLTEQKAFARVRTTISEKQSFLETTLKENKISFDNLNLIFVAYKDDDLLEVYAKTKKKRLTGSSSPTTFAPVRDNLAPRECKVMNRFRKGSITLTGSIQ